jgi:hypothetical protein
MLAGLGEFCLQFGHLRPEPFDLLTQTQTLFTGMGFCRFRHTDKIVVPSLSSASRPLYFVLLAALPALDVVLAPGLIQGKTRERLPDFDPGRQSLCPGSNTRRRVRAPQFRKNSVRHYYLPEQPWEHVRGTA